MIIYKYLLRQDPFEYQELDLPEYNTPLHVGEQDDKLYVWCQLTNESNTKVKKRFYVLGTGIDYATMDVRDQIRLNHIGTVQMSNKLVWHVFEV